MGDAQEAVASLGSPTPRFDVVLVHTLISHVTDPMKVLTTAFELLKDTGILVVFEGDYGSLTLACPDAVLGREMDLAIAERTFCQPLVMRQLPGMLQGLGWEIKEIQGDVVHEIGGQASYFMGMCETYVPQLLQVPGADKHKIQGWLDGQRAAVKNGTFFASCNYFSYFIGKT